MNTPLPTSQSRWPLDLATLGFWLGVSCLAALAGSLLTTPSIGTWYAALHKPAWNPPNAAFPIVWPILFTLMALAAWLVSRQRGQREGVGLALAVYGGHLLLNIGWSGLFFGLRRPDLALIEVGFLWLSIALTALLFARVSRLAAVLLLPYLAWVAFAACLNLAIWKLNA